MKNPSLSGHRILVCEDEALISLDIADALTKVGAQVVVTPTQKKALAAVEENALSAAILDYSLRDGDSSQLCARLNERNIPFMIYSGFDKRAGAYGDAILVLKPASTDVLVATVVGLLHKHGPVARLF